MTGQRINNTHEIWRLHGFRRIKIKITTDHAVGGLQDDRQQTL